MGEDGEEVVVMMRGIVCEGLEKRCLRGVWPYVSFFERPMGEAIDDTAEGHNFFECDDDDDRFELRFSRAKTPLVVFDRKLKPLASPHLPQFPSLTLSLSSTTATLSSCMSSNAAHPSHVLHVVEKHHYNKDIPHSCMLPLSSACWHRRGNDLPPYLYPRNETADMMRCV